MSDEVKVGTLVTTIVSIAFIVLCVTAKGCNDSNNELQKKMIEQHCTYVGGTFLCGGVK